MVVLVVLMLTAAPAAAAAPVFTHEQVYPATYFASCQEFDILASATADHSWTDFYANDGTWMRSVLRFRFTGTLYNGDDMTRMVPYSGLGVWTFLAPTGDGSQVYRYSAEIDGRPVRMVSGLAYWDFKSGEYMFRGLLDFGVACAALG